MIVVDSSVWINQLRGNDTPGTRTLKRLPNPASIVVGDLVLLEVLQGARSEAEAVRLERQLRQFEVCRMMSPDSAVEFARQYRTLRSFGVTVRKTVDMMIAGFCLREGHDLLTDDRDFQPFADHFGLRLL